MTQQELQALINKKQARMDECEALANAAEENARALRAERGVLKSELPGLRLQLRETVAASMVEQALAAAKDAQAKAEASARDLEAMKAETAELNRKLQAQIEDATKAAEAAAEPAA